MQSGTLDGPLKKTVGAGKQSFPGTPGTPRQPPSPFFSCPRHPPDRWNLARLVAVPRRDAVPRHLRCLPASSCSEFGESGSLRNTESIGLTMRADRAEKITRLDLSRTPCSVDHRRKNFLLSLKST